jgi:hypothetical protein
MAQLGIGKATARMQSTPAKPKRWTQSELTALLGALGSDASIETIAVRTGHTVKAVRAKIARLDYRADEIHGFAVFTVDELAEHIGVTPRQIRRWKERGWLETKNRRIPEDTLERFLREHADMIPFDTLRPDDQMYLIDLGYPCPEQKEFRQSVREILDGIGRQRKPRRPLRQNREERGLIHNSPQSSSCETRQASRQYT